MTYNRSNRTALPTAPGAWLLASALAVAASSDYAVAADPALAPQAPSGMAANPLPAGSIIAFVPNASGFTGTDAELRGWLAERRWALCDGTSGTPDLRDRMLYGTTEAASVGQRLGARDHDHRLRGETGTPVLRNRYTPTGRAELKHLPDDQHRHSIDTASDRTEHLPPSVKVLFIMKLP